MKKNLVYLAVFAAGAGIGVGATWQYFKTKYKHLADEEIQSVKDVFLKKNREEKEEHDQNVSKLIDIKEELEKMNTIATNYNACSKPATENKEESKMDDEPYVIPPEEFGESEDDYEQVTLFYYADGYIADDDDEIFHHIDETIGADAINHFGEYDDDAVYIRNDRLKTDYEILRSARDFKEVLKSRPYRDQGQLIDEELYDDSE